MFENKTISENETARSAGQTSGGDSARGRAEEEGGIGETVSGSTRRERGFGFDKTGRF